MITPLIGLGVARLVCFFRGHKRGKRTDETTVECPRCKRPKKSEQKARKKASA